jgi:RND family efflux transporter MFP subunit
MNFVSGNLPKIRAIGLMTAIFLLLAAFFYAAARSGPLAPIAVTVATVTSQPLTPALFGIGTVEARYSHNIGPTVAGRVLRVTVDVGETVKAGQLIAEIEPIDLDDRIAGQDAALKRAEAMALAAEAQVKEASSRAAFTATQARRYRQLFQSHSVSAEAADSKHQEDKAAEAALAAARAGLDAARQDLARIKAERAGLLEQRNNLRLTAPADGLVVSREAESGDTVVAGQIVIKLIDPSSLWIHVRFDQSRSSGLQTGLPAKIVLRSQAGQSINGRILRVEPQADAVTEETLVKVLFDPIPSPLPPLGELAEVTVTLPELPSLPTIPNGALKYADNKHSKNGVWLIRDNAPAFVPVQAGTADLEGMVQIISGIQEGDQIIVYSKQELTEGCRIKVVEHLVKDRP